MRRSLPLWLAFASACHPHVTVSWLEPAAVTLPADLTSLAVVDRVLSVESGVVAGALKGELYGSTRLTLVDEDKLDAALAQVVVHRPGPVPQAQLRTLCSVSGADGLAWIDAAGVVSSDQVGVSDQVVVVKKKTTTVKMYKVTRTFQADAAFTLQRCDGPVLDAVSRAASQQISASGRSEAAARGALSGGPEASAAALAAVGADYASHIVPTWTDARRPYYRSGHPDLVAGHEALAGQHLHRAQTLWTRVWDTADDDRDRGKAAFNLAVLSELSGDVEVAQKWSREAKKLLGETQMVTEYLAILRQRRVLDKAVQQQLQMSP